MEMMMQKVKDNVIIALDFPGGDEALDFLDKLAKTNVSDASGASDAAGSGTSGGAVLPYVKVGMELFYSEGPEIIREIKARGYRIFLDLKLHDIPNTVGRSMETLAKLGVDMVNCHAAGGRRMMEAALEGLQRGAQSGSVKNSASGCRRPLLIAVTQLTSTDERMLHDELMIDRAATVEDAVIRYAKNAKAAGLDGVVCSPLEAESIHREIGPGFLTVTPGIRFADPAAGTDSNANTGANAGANDDQHRITTPEMAGRMGSDYIVVGRPVTRADDPGDAYRKCREDFLKGEGR